MRSLVPVVLTSPEPAATATLKCNQVMTFRNIIAVYSEKVAKSINLNKFCEILNCILLQQVTYNNTQLYVVAAGDIQQYSTYIVAAGDIQQYSTVYCCSR